MNPNVSDIVLVNSLIEIAAKGFALQMQIKDFTHIYFFYRQQYIYFCSPTKAIFNKYNSVSSQFNNHSRQYRHYMVDATTNQFQDLMCQKKYNLVSMSQLNTVNNTDTVIDLNLNTNHLIDQPFSMDQQGIVSATGTFYYGIMEGEISTPLELF